MVKALFNGKGEKTMKYKIGDRVRIVNHRTSRMNQSGKMDKYLGKIMTIKRVCSFSYAMVEDNSKFFWLDEMIEGLVDEDISSNKLSKINGLYVINW